MFFEAKNLCFSYYRSPLCLKDVNFSFEKNSKIVCLASKEMGKSTLLKVLSGFEDSRFGNIFLNGTELKKIDDKDKNFSLLLSEPIFFENKTIEYNLNYQVDVLKVSFDNAKITDLLSQFNIMQDLNLKVKKLSLFEKRKLQIVRALLKKPQILFLDDQIEGLCDNEKAEMFEICKNLLSDKSLTIVCAFGNETYKKFNDKFDSIKFDKVLYLYLANILEYKNIKEFEKSYISLDIVENFYDLNLQDCFIERNGNEYSLCVDDEKLFVFEKEFNNDLGEMKLEFGEVEEVSILVLGEIGLFDFDNKDFNYGLKNKNIFVYSKLTGNLIIKNY